METCSALWTMSSWSTTGRALRPELWTTCRLRSVPVHLSASFLSAPSFPHTHFDYSPWSSSVLFSLQSTTFLSFILDCMHWFHCIALSFHFLVSCSLTLVFKGGNRWYTACFLDPFCVLAMYFFLKTGQTNKVKSNQYICSTDALDFDSRKKYLLKV